MNNIGWLITRKGTFVGPLSLQKAVTLKRIWGSLFTI